MSIKPVDFQIVIPKASELSKTYAEGLNRNQTLQHQQALMMQQKIDTNQKQVYSKDTAQEVRIREKQEREKAQENHKESQKGNEKKNKKNKPGFSDNQPRTSTIDIKI
ncbi:MAG TPA: hypothetical protein GXX14_04215 [Clostridiaceae bacterium]|nr:hypothetical protein [Clostridiaceae bacterium]